MKTAEGVKLSGKTTTAAIKKPVAKEKKVDDDASPLVSRRSWLVVAWGSFSAASAALLAATGRFMFPNVLGGKPELKMSVVGDSDGRRGAWRRCCCCS